MNEGKAKQEREVREANWQLMAKFLTKELEESLNQQRKDELLLTKSSFLFRRSNERSYTGSNSRSSYGTKS